jgi:hypothetical protein
MKFLGLPIELFAIIYLIILAILSHIPAKVAEKKGYSYWGFYAVSLFGFFFVSLVVALVASDKNNKLSISDELIKYKNLLDNNAITQNEYDEIKKDLLRTNKVQLVASDKNSPRENQKNVKSVIFIAIASVLLISFFGISIFAFTSSWIREADDYSVASPEEATSSMNTDGENEPVSMWEVKYFADEFGDETWHKYVTSTNALVGSFSNTATSNSILYVKLIITSTNGFGFELYEYNANNKVTSFSFQDVIMNVKDRYDNEYTFKCSGNERFIAKDVDQKSSMDMLSVLRKGGIVKFTVRIGSNAIYSKYNFVIEDASGFIEAYNQL